MTRLTLKGLWAQKRRLFLTAVAVTLSAALLSATLVLTAIMGGGAQDDIASANTSVDAALTGPVVAMVEGGPQELTGAVTVPVSEDVLRAVSCANGVASAAGLVGGFAQLVGTDGTPVGDGTRSAPVGLGWIDDPELSAYTVVEGRAPHAPDEVAVDKTTATVAHLAVGDRLGMVTDSGTTHVTLVGIATYGRADGPPVLGTTLVDPAAAHDMFRKAGFDRVLVTAKPGVSQEELVATLSALEVADGTEVVTGVQYVASLKKSVAGPSTILSAFLTAFALIVAGVGATLIGNTFVVSVTERTREIGLLRSVGASSRQILGMVAIEAAIIGVLASTVGAAVGVAIVPVLRAALETAGFPFFTTGISIPMWAPAVAAATGVAVTLVSAFVPAWRASRVPPMAALRDTSGNEAVRSFRRAAVGVVALVAGISMGAGGVVWTSAPIVGAAALAVVAGVFALGPALMGVLSRVGGVAVEALFGVVGRLAHTNAARNSRRSASTALALASGLALVSMFAVVADSLTASVSGFVGDNLRAEYVVTSLGERPGTIDAELGGDISALAGVTDVVALKFGLARAGAKTVALGGVDPATISSVYDLDIVAGSLTGLSSGGIAIYKDQADKSGATVGHTATLTVETGTELTGTIVAVYANALPGFDSPAYMVSRDTFERVVPGALDNQLYVKINGAEPAELAALVAARPGAQLLTAEKFTGYAGSEIAAILNPVYGLLALVVAIGVIGVANTMSLAVSQRVRELGILRAVGVNRAEMRRMVALEAFLLASAGAVLGVTLGLIGAWAMMEAIASTEFPLFSVPVLFLAGAVVGGAVMGTASALPATRRVSRMDVLSAIATE